MEEKRRRKILDYIYDRYTGQEVIEALITECPQTMYLTLEYYKIKKDKSRMLKKVFRHNIK